VPDKIKKIPKSLGFEDAMAELEALVTKLESGEQSLEESLQHFERGIGLARHCQLSLKTAEQKVQVLMQQSDGDAKLVSGYQERVYEVLLSLLPAADANQTQLPAAMRYAVTVGGKRIRPILTYATGQALGVSLDRLDVPAAAVEMLHAYSLVHDDLPAMDDDALRRGQPTCHIQFDEATAILAGDALQALAFTLLAANDDSNIPADNKLRMETMHRHKTGALIRASVALAGLTANSQAEEIMSRLDRFAAAIGLCFQIVDDILDVVADTDTLGKQQGADMALNKPTYPALLGLDGAREHASQMRDCALAELEGLGTQFDELRQIANYITKRRH